MVSSSFLCYFCDILVSLDIFSPLGVTSKQENHMFKMDRLL